MAEFKDLVNKTLSEIKNKLKQKLNMETNVENTEKTTLNKPVVSGSVLCEGCREDGAINVRVLNEEYTKDEWLCKECIRVNFECGRLVEIL